MKSLVVAVLLLILAYNSNAQDGFVAKTAIEYNDFFVNNQNEIYNALQIFNDDVAVNLDSARFDLLVVSLMVSMGLDDIEKVQVYEGGQELKNSYYALFKYYDLVVNNHFVELLDLLQQESLSDTDNERLGQLIDEVTELEKPLDERAKAAQIAFAALHGFKLE